MTVARGGVVLLALVLGTGELSEACASLLASDNDLGLGFAGILVRAEDPANGAHVVGRYADLRRVVSERLHITPDEMDGGHLPALARPKELVDRFEAYRKEAGLP